MQTNYEAEQISMYDLDTYCGRTSPEPFPAERPRAKISGSSSKKLSELSAIPFMSLDLTPGHGNLLGESYWEMISPWRGGALTLNTGVSPSDVKGSSLSQILQADPPTKYYLTPKACLGILRRASERGKELPKKLARALKIQAGLMRPDGQPTGLDAYHINQRDEGIDLHGVSGALMATTNMQMQTFVTQPDEREITAFAANQRDEVRDLHNVAGALQASPGMKQQTFVAAGFSAGAGASAGSIGYGEELAPTLKGSASGNCMPSVLCLNDQGGNVMECSENVSGTLQAQEHGHQPLVYENHGIDSRYTGPHKVAPTMSARYGTGGNNVPLVEQEPDTICIAGNTVDRQPQNGGNGLGCQEELAYTLTAMDRHAVYARQRVDEFKDCEVVSTQSARQHTLRQKQRLLYRPLLAVASRAVQLHHPSGRQTRCPQGCVPASEALFDERAAVHLAWGGTVAQGTGTPGQILGQLPQGCLGVLFGKRRVPRRQRVLGALGDLLFAPVLNIKMLVGVEMAHGHTPPYGDVAVRKNADESRQRTLLPSSQRRSAAANKFSFV